MKISYQNSISFDYSFFYKIDNNDKQFYIDLNHIDSTFNKMVN